MQLSECCSAETNSVMVDDMVGHGLHEAIACSACGILDPEMYEDRKLRKVELNEGYLVEDWCREMCQDNDIPSMLPELYKSWQETLQYHLGLNEKYLFIDGEIWEVLEQPN
jgi:hypothetical protein